MLSLDLCARNRQCGDVEGEDAHGFPDALGRTLGGDASPLEIWQYSKSPRYSGSASPVIAVELSCLNAGFPDKPLGIAIRAKKQIACQLGERWLFGVKLMGNGQSGD